MSNRYTPSGGLTNLDIEDGSWHDGDSITASKLNHIDNGIINLDNQIANLDTNVTQINTQMPSSRIFETVADIENQIDLVLGDIVQTCGYYSAGDGGAALYKIKNRADVSSTSMPTTAIHFIKTTSLAAVLIDELNKDANKIVERYGIVGSGDQVYTSYATTANWPIIERNSAILEELLTKNSDKITLQFSGKSYYFCKPILITSNNTYLDVSNNDKSNYIIATPKLSVSLRGANKTSTQICFATWPYVSGTVGVTLVNNGILQAAGENNPNPAPDALIPEEYNTKLYDFISLYGAVNFSAENIRFRGSYSKSYRWANGVVIGIRNTYNFFFNNCSFDGWNNAILQKRYVNGNSSPAWTGNINNCYFVNNNIHYNMSNVSSSFVNFNHDIFLNATYYFAKVKGFTNFNNCLIQGDPTLSRQFVNIAGERKNGNSINFANCYFEQAKYASQYEPTYAIYQEPFYSNGVESKGIYVSIDDNTRFAGNLLIKTCDTPWEYKMRTNIYCDYLTRIQELSRTQNVACSIFSKNFLNPVIASFDVAAAYNNFTTYGTQNKLTGTKIDGENSTYYLGREWTTSIDPELLAGRMICYEYSIKDFNTFICWVANCSSKLTVSNNGKAKLKEIYNLDIEDTTKIAPIQKAEKIQYGTGISFYDAGTNRSKIRRTGFSFVSWCKDAARGALQHINDNDDERNTVFDYSVSDFSMYRGTRSDYVALDSPITVTENGYSITYHYMYDTIANKRIRMFRSLGQTTIFDYNQYQLETDGNTGIEYLVLSDEPERTVEDSGILITKYSINNTSGDELSPTPPSSNTNEEDEEIVDDSDNEENPEDEEIPEDYEEESEGTQGASAADYDSSTIIPKTQYDLQEEYYNKDDQANYKLYIIVPILANDVNKFSTTLVADKGIALTHIYIV